MPIARDPNVRIEPGLEKQTLGMPRVQNPLESFQSVLLNAGFELCYERQFSFTAETKFNFQTRDSSGDVKKAGSEHLYYHKSGVLLHIETLDGSVDFIRAFSSDQSRVLIGGPERLKADCDRLIGEAQNPWRHRPQNFDLSSRADRPLMSEFRDAESHRAAIMANIPRINIEKLNKLPADIRDMIGNAQVKVTWRDSR